MPEMFFAADLVFRCGVGKRFTSAELTQFSKEYQKIGQEEDSLFITGPRGTGKTHFLCACMKRFLRDKINAGEINPDALMTTRKQPVRFVSVPELLLEFKNSYRDDAEQSETAILEKYTNMELLVLDDLGAERVSEWSVQMLYMLIDRRNRDMKPTMISSNLKLAEVADQLDDRIASRIAEMCYEARLRGQDIRLVRRAEKRAAEKQKKQNCQQTSNLKVVG